MTNPMNHDIVLYSVNEEGQSYGRSFTLTEALVNLDRFPNDTIVIAVIGSPTDRRFAEADFVRPFDTVDLTPIYHAEWQNYRAMQRDAISHHEPTDVPLPTYGSALDSWRQAPDHIQREWMPGVDPTAIDAALAAHPADEPLPTASR
jgi:hypothetical protein